MTIYIYTIYTNPHPVQSILNLHPHNMRYLITRSGSLTMK